MIFVFRLLFNRITVLHLCVLSQFQFKLRYILCAVNCIFKTIPSQFACHIKPQGIPYQLMKASCLSSAHLAMHVSTVNQATVKNPHVLEARVIA